MLLGKLKKAFTDNWTGRALGAALAFGAVAMPIVATPGPANDAYAQSGQVARAPDSVRMADEMDAYSQDPATRGIGVFINLQADAPADGGERLGNLLKGTFAKKGIPLEFRVHQSRGTGTDIYFYVRGVVVTLGIGEIKAKLSTVLNHHRGAWLPETASLEPNKPVVTR